MFSVSGLIRVPSVFIRGSIFFNRVRPGETATRPGKWWGGSWSEIGMDDGNRTLYVRHRGPPDERDEPHGIGTEGFGMTRLGRPRWLILVALGVGLLVIRGDQGPAAAVDGARLPDFSVRGLDGRLVHLDEVAGKGGTVLVFTGNDCPNSNKSVPRLVALAAAYGPKGIAFLGVNSNASQNAAAVAAHAREHGLSFPVCKDRDNVVADRARGRADVRGGCLRCSGHRPLPRGDRRPVRPGDHPVRAGPQLPGRRARRDPRRATGRGRLDPGHRLPDRAGRARNPAGAGPARRVGDRRGPRRP